MVAVADLIRMRALWVPVARRLVAEGWSAADLADAQVRAGADIRSGQPELVEAWSVWLEGEFARERICCATCAHIARPGRCDGYCAVREDLPYAYTPGHPLRQLPADGGVSCICWASGSKGV